MARNPFFPDSNNDNAAHRLGRPSRHIAAYRDVSDETLSVLQEWHDEATTEAKAAAERKARMAAWEQTEEAEQARQQMRRSYMG